MDKILVMVFDNELRAYEGARALQDLMRAGRLNLYSKAVIARDASGRTAVKQQGDMGPLGTAVGLLTGSLIGLLGGPLGFAIGAGVGTLRGLVHDLAHIGVGEDFLREVAHSLKPGKAAVIAEVWEEWTKPVDFRMKALGGTVYRRTRREYLDAQIMRDVAALKAELDLLEAEHDQASGEARENLEARVGEARDRLQAAQDEIREKIEISQQEIEAKVAALQEQAAQESGERKASLEARIAELEADQKRRSELFRQALELTNTTLNSTLVT